MTTSITGSVVDAARAIAPAVAARAAETEARRSVPDGLVDEMRAAGLFTLYVPASLGGPEVDPRSAFEAIETLSEADGSTGWTAMILNTTLMTNWLDPDIARGVLGDPPGAGMAGNFGPIGTAVVQADGRLLVSGRWPFNSGCPHASWLSCGVVVDHPNGDHPFDWRVAFMPAADVEIVDTWRAVGLRGTASHHVVADGVVVAPELTVDPAFTPACSDAPLFRWSFFAILGSLMGAFPLGVARRALDEFRDLAVRKGRGFDRPLAEEQICEVEMARCEGSLRAARAFVCEVIDEAWAHALAGGRMTADQRIAVRLAAGNAMRVGVDVVDTVFRLAGGGALYDESPLQRCWRDIHAGSNHLYFSDNHAAVVGRLLFGLPTREEWLA